MLWTILFEILFPIILIIFVIIVLLKGIKSRRTEQNLMTLDEFITDWLYDHGQGHKIDEQFNKMKHEPTGFIYMPLTYRGGKFFLKLGLNSNDVSILNLLFSFIIFWGVIIASRGHNMALFSQQPFYGVWFIPLAFLVLFTGVIDGVDGAIARLSDNKTASGAWFDNIIDRISDTLLLVCLIPETLVIIPETTINLEWIIWTNILLMFIYEYMRARHQSLGLREVKPYVAERPTRIMLNTTFFLIYGISSFTILLTKLIDPSSVLIWAVSHSGVINWSMIIYQVLFLGLMVFSSIKLANYSYKNLKIIDSKSKQNNKNQKKKPMEVLNK
ncbi:MAG: hypothetical protein GF317_19335 [Candidatus Lokiarchaeota archaeon]|nr:hypothetical protein [Candidatus Lokiarchaeota archaeon]MBD3201652.1 hypothetical protein [Candidatus Lokiarchaeota archaeon]